MGALQVAGNEWLAEKLLSDVKKYVFETGLNKYEKGPAFARPCMMEYVFNCVLGSMVRCGFY